MDTRDIVVIGASAGGVEALRDLVGALPADLPASLFVVLHMSSGPTVLPEILNRKKTLRAAPARDHETIRHGRIYVAPPDHHLLLDDHRMRVIRGPQHNRHRPAIDPLFRSASRVFGPRVIGIVLSGALDDGTAGLITIKRRGGMTVVQDPDTALIASMPRSAMESVDVDHSLPPEQIGVMLNTWVRERAGGPQPLPDPRLDQEFDTMMGNPTDPGRQGKPSVFTCPECHGTLWELDENGLLQFRCRVGHSYSPQGLLADNGTSLEASLWAGVRSLEEHAALTRRLAGRLAESSATKRLYAEAETTEEHARQLRELVERTGRTLPPLEDTGTE